MLLNFLCLVYAKIIKKEHKLLFRQLAPELFKELNIALLIEGALLNHVALKPLLQTYACNDSLCLELMS